MGQAAEVGGRRPGEAHFAQELAVGGAEALDQKRLARGGVRPLRAVAGEGGREKRGDKLDAVVGGLAAAVAVEDAEACDGGQPARRRSR